MLRVCAVSLYKGINMKKSTSVLTSLILSISSTSLIAGVDSDFKARPDERFVVYTGDGNYKQAYHWAFNENGEGPAVTIFLNHGSGSEWYKQINTEFGPCGPDYIANSGDFDGSNYEGLCEVDGEGDKLYLADFNIANVPVGPLLNDFMLKKIVGSTQFAAWYWQDAFQQFDSPVHIFMVGRYNIAKDPGHLNNALFWLNPTDSNSVTRDTLPPYNFDGNGVADIDTDLRPMHAAPDISGFDNMFLYKAVEEQYPQVSLANLIIEGRSDGGSAMIALASDYHIWPDAMRDFWARNLPLTDAQEEPQPEPEVVPALTIADIANDPALTAAFNAMLSEISQQDIEAIINNNQNLALYSNNVAIEGSAGIQPVEYVESNQTGFSVETFPSQLASYIKGDFYQAVKLVHSFYPGCQLQGIMEKDLQLPQDQVDADGDNAIGYQVALKTMFSFASQDSLYVSACDDRVIEGAPYTSIAGAFSPSDIVQGQVAVIGDTFSPAGHGFDYDNVYKNQPERSVNDQAKAAESRRAIERVVNQSFKELNLQGTYQLPENLE
jgi:hypothetical protein